MSLLAATQTLIEHWQSKQEHSFSELKKAAFTVYKQGSEADRAAIFALCVDYPSCFEQYFIQNILLRWGDLALAERLYQAHFQADRLKNEDYPEWLSILAALGLEKVKPALIHYALGPYNNHYTQKEACFGLLKMDCGDIQPLIIEQIRACYGQPLFREFVPMLAAKVENPAIRTEILQQLYKLGNETASTDCNGGLILAFSLCGDEGGAFFQKILWDKNWECTGSGTGSAYCSYQGIQNLAWGFSDLYQQIQQLPPQSQSYAVRVWLDLLQIGLNSPYQPPKEGYLSLYQRFFAAESEHFAQLQHWATQSERQEELEDCAAQLQKQLQAEI